MWLWHYLVCVTFDLFCYVLNQSFGWAEMTSCNPFDPMCVCSVTKVMSDFDRMDCSSPGFSVHEILQARILKWVGILSPGNLPDPGIELASLVSLALPGRFFTIEPSGTADVDLINMEWVWDSSFLTWFQVIPMPLTLRSHCVLQVSTMFWEVAFWEADTFL